MFSIRHFMDYCSNLIFSPDSSKDFHASVFKATLGPTPPDFNTQRTTQQRSQHITLGSEFTQSRTRNLKRTFRIRKVSVKEMMEKTGSELPATCEENSDFKVNIMKNVCQRNLSSAKGRLNIKMKGTYDTVFEVLLSLFRHFFLF